MVDQEISTDCMLCSKSLIILMDTRAHRRAGCKPLDEAGDIGQFTERDFCQTEAASDVISGKGEKGD